MADSYEKRIAAAEDSLVATLLRRDACYPGSPEWESEEAKRHEWARLIEDLRRQMAS